MTDLNEIIINKHGEPQAITNADFEKLIPLLEEAFSKFTGFPCTCDVFSMSNDKSKTTSTFKITVQTFKGPITKIMIPSFEPDHEVKDEE